MKRASLLIELIPNMIDHDVRPLASPSDDDVGALPVRSPVFLDPYVTCSKSHASGPGLQFEIPRLHLLVVRGPDLLLIGHDANLGMLSPFLQVI